MRPVWVNELGGTTFALTDGPSQRRFVTWSCGIALAAEAARLRWAVSHMRVPALLHLDADDDAYGVADDPARMAWYRLRWDLS